MSLNLLGSTSRVETPLIYVTIGDTIFGAYNKSYETLLSSSGATKKFITTFPNFMKSITIEKVNGTINSYSIQMIYAIRNGDDPNLLEKVFSSVSKDRRIRITYGDASIPSMIFKDEEALITDIKSNLNISSSVITYTLTCVSASMALNAGKYTFAKDRKKPSEKIKEILFDTSYGLQDIFYGMRDKDLVLSTNLLASDDKVVDIEAKTSITVLDYLKYLVTCMIPATNIDIRAIDKNRYALVVIDDTTHKYGGPYFKITKLLSSETVTNELDVYEIDIGTHSKDMIIDFSIDDNQTYSILYNYSQQIKQPNYIYRIDDKGKMTYEYSPIFSNSPQLMKTTAADRNWWTTMTQYPISCTLTLKGLLRPAILMSYVRLNVYFYGNKHISSGLYIVTRETDTISEAGSRTTLKLTRIQGDIV